jgi:type IV secretion system protein VirB1
MDFAATAAHCAPNMQVELLSRVAAVESGYNPYAIGVVGGKLARQPRTLAEALATAQMLAATGWDYSLGIVQVNQKNFGRYNLTLAAAFDPCSNLRVGAAILDDCLKRAGASDHALGDALSCYYSGNFRVGYTQGYVAKVAAVSRAGEGAPVAPIPVIATARRLSAKATLSPAARATSISPFVSAAQTPAPTVATAGDPPSSAPGRSTALLF